MLTAVEADLREKIAGEVVLSPHPGRTLRKWRRVSGSPSGTSLDAS